MIRLHFHQIQLTMYCAEVDRLILIVYVLHRSFDIVQVQRDEAFIAHCLPLLKFAYFTHMFRYDIPSLLRTCCCLTTRKSYSSQRR